MITGAWAASPCHGTSRESTHRPKSCQPRVNGGRPAIEGCQCYSHFVVTSHAVQVPGIDASAIDGLIARIVASWKPEQIWLFGSRARGTAAPDSDWDLLVVVPDGADETGMDPVSAWRLRRESGVRADIVPCRASDFREDSSTPNTLAFEAAKHGQLVYER